MLAYLSLFAFAFTTGLSGAMMPGPMFAFTVSSAAKRGPHVGVLVIIGHGIVESTLVVAIFAGARAFLENSNTLLRVIGGVGALALLFLGVTMLLQVRRLSLAKILAEGKDAQKSKVEHPILGGIVTTALNPTFLPWWMSAGLVITTKFAATAPNIAVFYAGHLSSDLAWYWFISMAIGFGRKFIPDWLYKVFISAAAILLIVFAVIFAKSAITGVK